MSLEQKLDELNTNIAKLINVTQALHDLRADAIEKVTAAAASPGAGKGKKTDETKAEPVKAETGNISKSPEERVDTTEEAKTLAADYISGSDREDERAARKAKVKALLNHDKVRAEGVKAGEGGLANIGNFKLFKDQIAKLTEKGDITEAPAKSEDLDLD